MKTVKALFGVLLLLATGFFLWKVAPHYMDNIRFKDVIERETLRHAYTKTEEAEIRELLWNEARALNLPLTREQIIVQRQGGTISVWADYAVPVSLPGYTFELNFQTHSKTAHIISGGGSRRR